MVCGCHLSAPGPTQWFSAQQEADGSRPRGWGGPGAVGPVGSGQRAQPRRVSALRVQEAWSAGSCARGEVGIVEMGEVRGQAQTLQVEMVRASSRPAPSAPPAHAESEAEGARPLPSAPPEPPQLQPALAGTGRTPTRRSSNATAVSRRPRRRPDGGLSGRPSEVITRRGHPRGGGARTPSAEDSPPRGGECSGMSKVTAHRCR